MHVVAQSSFLLLIGFQEKKKKNRETGNKIRNQETIFMLLAMLLQ